jgi:Fe-S cluster assembly iron-binding protein IscA
VSNIDALSEPPPGSGARVVLFTRPGCHLCDAARAVVERVTTDLGEQYTERDITLDPADLRAYVDSIPVVVVDGVQVDFWRVSEDRLRAALLR